MTAHIALVCLAFSSPVHAPGPARVPKAGAYETKIWGKAKIGSDIWTIKSRSNFSDFGCELLVLRNRKVMKRMSSDYLYGGKFLAWPFKARLVVLSRHSQAGHGLTSWFYVVRNKRLVGPLLRIEHEVGGPIFKDMDGDGRPEMIFDNYDYYVFYDKPPTKLSVYKVSKDYRISIWKTVPNSEHKNLKFLLPYF